MGKKSQPAAAPAPTPLRPSDEVYHRIRWDVRFDPARFTIGYETRRTGLQEMPFLQFVPGGDVPWHRLYYFRDGANIVWDRRTRYDHILGSGDPRAKPGEASIPRPGPATKPADRAKPPRPDKHAARPLSAYRFDAQFDRWAISAESSPVEAREELKLLTWNVLTGPQEPRRTALLLRLLKEAQAEVIALQEVVSSFLEALLAEAWVRSAYAVSTLPGEITVTPSGQVLLSRLPLRSLRFIEDSPPKRVVVGEVAWGERVLRMVALHLTSDHAEGAEGKRGKQLVMTLDHLRQSPAAWVDVLLGDFNSDDARPAGGSFGDAWELARPGEPGLTFDPERNGLAAGNSLTGKARRLDRILVRPASSVIASAAELLGAEAVDGIMASDHFGVACVLRAQEVAVEELEPVTTSALVVIPPESQWAPIQALRRQHDSHVARWMPHVSLLYGFIPELFLDEAVERLAPVVASFEPFTVTLSRFGDFAHRTSATAWVAPDSEPVGELERLQAALQAELPKCDQQSRLGGRFQPHLTLGQLGSSEEARAVIASWKQSWKPPRFEVGELCVISRRGEGLFEVRRRIPLGKPPRERALLRVEEVCTEVEGEARVYALGSHRLGTAADGGDLDLVCVASLAPAAFREGVQRRLGGRAVEEAVVPVQRLEVGGVSVDLAYARRPAGVGVVAPEELSAEDFRAFDPAAQRSLQGVRDAEALLGLGSEQVGAAAFRELVRRVREWSEARELRSNAFGFLGGYSWAQLCAWCCAHARAAERAALWDRFFATFGEWDWAQPVAFSEKGARGVVRARHERLCLVTPTEPYLNSARNVTRSTEQVLSTELRSRRSERVDPEKEHPARLSIEIEASDAAAFELSRGWVEGHVLGLILDLEKGGPVRPYPRLRAAAATRGWYWVGVEAGTEVASREAGQRFEAAFAQWVGKPVGASIRAREVR